MTETLLPGDTPPVAVDASVDEILSAAGRIRAGRVLTPPAWKDGARVAVCITFDVDNEFPWLAMSKANPVKMSWGEYGATTGMPRILRTLEKHAAPASFYIPAGSAALHPEMIPAILAPGIHEIGIHGWTHEHLPSLESAEQERELLRRSIEYITEASGGRPVGYRAPFWDFSAWTLDLVLAEGFRYDSSMMAMDQPYEIVADGRPTGLVEIPVHAILDDVVYDGPWPDHDGMGRVFRAEFDAAYDEGTLFMLTMHPMVSGLRSRVAMLDQLLTHIRSRPDVWIATAAEVADFARASASW
jgi:peptidoglycan/xylan/chitin deacetylase (PgdA/CDA1 family)